MKSLRIILWLCLLTGAQTLCAQALKFDELLHQFGEVEEAKGKVTHTFRFRNMSSKPVKISTVTPSCGCTSPEFTQTPVQPGDTGFVRAIFNPVNRPGQFSKSLTVRLEGSDDTYVLRILGSVIPRPKGPKELYPFEDGNLRFKTNHFVLGKIYHDETQTLTSILYNQGNKPIRFSASGTKLPAHIRLKLTKTTLQPGDTLLMTLKYETAKKKDWGTVTESFGLATDDAPRAQKIILVSADIRERFTETTTQNPPRINLSATQYDFGKVKQGEKLRTSFTIQNKGKSNLILRKVHTPCSCVQLRTNRTVIPPGEEATLDVQFNTEGKTDQQSKEITLITNDPDHQVIQIEIRADVDAPLPQ